MPTTNDLVPFDVLDTADLVLDRTYQGGAFGDVRDDPIARLLPVGNQGGFRYSGSPRLGTVRLVALYTTGAEPDWPDELDLASGSFTYYGDNRSPGRELHDTQRQGNRLLANLFEKSRSGPEARKTLAPVLLFEKVGIGRSVRFRGLLAPGGPTLSPDQELVAVWRSARGQRFQNYRAILSVLDVHSVSRQWLMDVLSGDTLSAACPLAWRNWVRSRTFDRLLAPPTITIRSKADQLPSSTADTEILSLIHAHFAERPTDFEQFAADLWQRTDLHVERIDVTRPWRDGGRDATGDYLIGPEQDPVAVEFALEAKCYRPGNGVGIRATSRLISRLRHRQFGVLVTTSYVDSQAYHEIREDAHPVVIVAGADMVRFLRKQGMNGPADVRRFLTEQYPPPTYGSGASPQ